VAAAVRQILAGHEPYPAVVVNARSELLDANSAVDLFLRDVAPHLMTPPVNVLRVALHPDGMAPNIVNLPTWRSHLLERLRRQTANSGDPTLRDLHDELSAYPGGESAEALDAGASVALPMVYRHGGRQLTFVSTLAVFGAPRDITVAELAIEAFYPGDSETAAVLRSATAVS
jgi:hypothetical protein